MGQKRPKLTSTTSAESSIAMAALGANTDDLSVDVLGVIGVDVAGATAAVGNFRRSGHFLLGVVVDSRYVERRICPVTRW